MMIMIDDSITTNSNLNEFFKTGTCLYEINLKPYLALDGHNELHFRVQDTG